MCFLVCVCVWASCILYVCGVCLGPGPPRSCCVYTRRALKWLRPVKGSSSATDQNTSGQWSQPVKWIDVRQENKWVSDSFPLSDESRVTAESLFTETEEEGEVRLAGCWRCPPAACALSQVLFSFGDPRPCKTRIQQSAGCEGSIQKPFLSAHSGSLSICSVPHSPPKNCYCAPCPLSAFFKK